MSGRKLRGVLVLGMHRSGTSAVTRVLSLLGLAACRPDDAVRGPWNPAGHFESRSLMALDDRMLSDMGCTWWHPPETGDRYGDFEARIGVRVREARRVFRQAYPSRRWVWKDPRACLLLPFWRRALGDDVAAVVVLRNPLDVAESLESRNATTTSFGVALWERYNRLFFEHARGMPVLVTRYDDLVDDTVSWARDVSGALGALGVALDPSDVAGRVGGSVEAGFRHSVHGQEELARRFPGAAAMYETAESVLGSWESFEPPELGPEPPEVGAELAALGPDTPPGWRPPPWLGEERPTA